MTVNPLKSLKSRSVRPRAHAAAGLAASLGAAALLVPAGALAAQAKPAGQSGSGCSPVTTSEPFTAWGDTNPYTLVAGGDFEHGTAGWTLSSGAGIVAGSESFGATGAVGTSSLQLGAGASAQTPPICVTAGYPSLRLFARGLTPGAAVLVQVIYDSGVLNGQTVGVGAVVPSLNGKWGPSPVLGTLAAVDLLNGGSAQVSLRFTELSGQAQIDDVFVDPRLTY